MTDYRLQAIQEFVQALLKDKRCLYDEDNILYCEKLFIVNSIMNQVYDKVAKGEMSVSEMKKYLRYVNKYLDGELSLFWKDNNLMVSNNNEKG
jgi:hypothetical protein